MLINEVETKVGLTKKSIRYYEDHGLLKPERDTVNSYRIYDEEDVKKLEIIKFLRELDVPIKELKLLNDGEITLQECMSDRIKKIDEQEKNYQKVKNMCMEIEKSSDTYENIDIKKYLEQINILNKKGFSMKKDIDEQNRKIRGAFIASFVIGLFFLFFLLLIFFIQITLDEKMPIILFIFIEGIFLIPLIGIISNFIMRVKEIRSGEEDEAKKY